MERYSDISNLKSGEEKPIDVRHIISGVTETLPDLITVLALPSRKLLYINTDSFLLNGYKNENLTYLSNTLLSESVHPEDQGLLDKYFESILQLKVDEVATVEYRSKNENSEWIWFRCRGRVFDRDSLGNVLSCVNVIQNISTQKKSEEALVKNFTLLKQAEEIAEVGSWEYDIFEEELKWSEGMYHLFDLVPEQKILPEIYLKHVLPEQKPIAEKIIHHLRFQNEPFQYLLSVKTLKGIRIQKVKGTVIYDELGIPKKMLGIHVDITEQVTAENKLREQLHIIGQITGASPDLIFIFDVNTLEIRYYTRTVADAIGYSREQIGKMKNIMMDVIHSDDHKIIHNCVRRVKLAADGEVVETEYRVLDPNGKIRWFRDRNTVFKRNEKNEVLEKIVFSHEITDQKLAESELKKSHERFETAINMAPMVLSILTCVRNDEGVIVDFAYEFVNKSAIETNGKNIIGSKMFMEFPEVKDLPVFSEFVNTVETGAACDLTFQFSPENNGPWVRWRAVKFDDGLFVSIEDITEKKKMETQALQNTLSQQKEILNAIILAQEQERERIGEALHNGVAQLLYVIQTRLQLVNAHTAEENKQIKDILGIVSEAINDTRQISFELVPAVLKDYGIDVALKSLLQKIIGDSLKLDVRLELKRRLPEKTEFAIYRIVQELVNNILKHSGATAAQVELSIKRKYILLEVSDNGCGFAKQEIKNLSNGIGLQSVKNRVNLLEGQLKINSILNKGTSIQIKLPL